MTPPSLAGSRVWLRHINFLQLEELMIGAIGVN
jgi:hypothetical protein